MYISSFSLSNCNTDARRLILLTMDESNTSTMTSESDLLLPPNPQIAPRDRYVYFCNCNFSYFYVDMKQL